MLFEFKNFVNIGDNVGEYSSVFYFVMLEVFVYLCFGKGWLIIWF